MDNRQLLYFKTVCDEGGFTKAAEKLYISPQGINKAIHRLEDELGVPLFENTPMGLMLTEYGVALKNQIEPYLTQHNRIMDMIESMRERADFALSIGVQSGFCDTLPENFLTDFITENPDIRTSIKSFHRDRLMEAMGESSIKIWLCTRPYDGDIFETLYERKTKLFLIVGRNHPLAGRKSVGMGELSRYPIVNIPSDLGHQHRLRASMSEVGAAPQYLLDPADRPLTMGLVSRGAAVSFHAGRFYQNYPDIVRVELDDMDAVEVSECIVIRRDAHRTEGIGRFLSYMRGRLGS